MKINYRFKTAAVLLALLGFGWLVRADEPRERVGKATPPIAAADFPRLHALIRPQPGESKWAQIPWLTNLEEARQKAAATDRPLLVWRSGGGDVLGRA